MKPPFTISYIPVDPEQAQDWLDKTNTANRKLRDSTVRALAGDMAAGEWVTNHQGIAFGESGKLLDGQHRLAAIVRSGVTIPLLVFRQVPERIAGKKQATMDTIDRGSPRTIGDMLKLQHGVEKYEVFVAAVCNTLLDICTVDLRQRRVKMTLRQTLDILDVASQQIRWLVNHRPHTKGLTSATVLGPFCIAYQRDPAAAQAALVGLGTGAGLGPESPILTLRNFLLSSGISGGGGRRAKCDKLRVTNVVLACLWSQLTGEELPKLEARRVDRYARQLVETWPDLIARCHQVAAFSPAPAPVRLTPYAESLLQAKETSTKIHRRLRKIS